MPPRRRAGTALLRTAQLSISPRAEGSQQRDFQSEISAPYGEPSSPIQGYGGFDTSSEHRPARSDLNVSPSVEPPAPRNSIAPYTGFDSRSPSLDIDDFDPIQPSIEPDLAMSISTALDLPDLESMDETTSPNSLRHFRSSRSATQVLPGMTRDNKMTGPSSSAGVYRSSSFTSRQQSPMPFEHNLDPLHSTDTQATVPIPQGAGSEETSPRHIVAPHASQPGHKRNLASVASAAKIVPARVGALRKNERIDNRQAEQGKMGYSTSLDPMPLDAHILSPSRRLPSLLSVGEHLDLLHPIPDDLSVFEEGGRSADDVSPEQTSSKLKIAAKDPERSDQDTDTEPEIVVSDEIFSEDIATESDEEEYVPSDAETPHQRQAKAPKPKKWGLGSLSKNRDEASATKASGRKAKLGTASKGATLSTIASKSSKNEQGRSSRAIGTVPSTQRSNQVTTSNNDYKKDKREKKSSGGTTPSQMEFVPDSQPREDVGLKRSTSARKVAKKSFFDNAAGTDEEVVGSTGKMAKPKSTGDAQHQQTGSQIDGSSEGDDMPVFKKSATGLVSGSSPAGLPAQEKVTCKEKFAQHAAGKVRVGKTDVWNLEGSPEDMKRRFMNSKISSQPAPIEAVGSSHNLRGSKLTAVSNSGKKRLPAKEETSEKSSEALAEDQRRSKKRKTEKAPVTKTLASKKNPPHEQTSPKGQPPSKERQHEKEPTKQSTRTTTVEQKQPTRQLFLSDELPSGQKPRPVKTPQEQPPLKETSREYILSTEQPRPKVPSSEQKNPTRQALSGATHVEQEPQADIIHFDPTQGPTKVKPAEEKPPMVNSQEAFENPYEDAVLDFEAVNELIQDDVQDTRDISSDQPGYDNAVDTGAFSGLEAPIADAEIDVFRPNDPSNVSEPHNNQEKGLEVSQRSPSRPQEQTERQDAVSDLLAESDTPEPIDDINDVGADQVAGNDNATRRIDGIPRGNRDKIDIGLVTDRKSMEELEKITGFSEKAAEKKRAARHLDDVVPEAKKVKLTSGVITPAHPVTAKLPPTPKARRQITIQPTGSPAIDNVDRYLKPEPIATEALKPTANPFASRPRPTDDISKHNMARAPNFEPHNENTKSFEQSIFNEDGQIFSNSQPVTMASRLQHSLLLANPRSATFMPGQKPLQQRVKWKAPASLLQSTSVPHEASRSLDIPQTMQSMVPDLGRDSIRSPPRFAAEQPKSPEIQLLRTNMLRHNNSPKQAGTLLSQSLSVDSPAHDRPHSPPKVHPRSQIFAQELCKPFKRVNKYQVYAGYPGKNTRPFDSRYHKPLAHYGPDKRRHTTAYYNTEHNNPESRFQRPHETHELDRARRWENAVDQAADGVVGILHAITTKMIRQLSSKDEATTCVVGDYQKNGRSIIEKLLKRQSRERESAAKSFRSNCDDLKVLYQHAQEDTRRLKDSMSSKNARLKQFQEKRQKSLDNLRAAVYAAKKECIDT